MRLLTAARPLAAGGSLNDCAFNAGYASPSAFITAFRRMFDTTPGRLSAIIAPYSWPERRWDSAAAKAIVTAKLKLCRKKWIERYGSLTLKAKEKP